MVRGYGAEAEALLAAYYYCCDQGPGVSSPFACPPTPRSTGCGRSSLMVSQLQLRRERDAAKDAATASPNGSFM